MRQKLWLEFKQKSCHTSNIKVLYDILRDNSVIFALVKQSTGQVKDALVALYAPLHASVVVF